MSPSLLKLGKFLMIGGGTAVVGAVFLEVLLARGWEELSAVISQNLLTYTVNFSLNSVITWSDRRANLQENLKRIVKFVPLMIVLGVINTISTGFLISFGVYHHLAYLIGLVITFGIKFRILDKRVFLEKKG